MCNGQCVIVLLNTNKYRGRLGHWLLLLIYNEL
jgi:hypothetical protein